MGVEPGRSRLILTDMSSSDEEQEDKSPFISVYKPIAGWKAIAYHWTTPEPPLPGVDGYWEPLETSGIAFTTKEAAASYARTWAEKEGIRFVENNHDPEEVLDGNETVKDKMLQALEGSNIEVVDLKGPKGQGDQDISVPGNPYTRYN